MKKVELLIDVADFKSLEEIVKSECDSLVIGDGLSKFTLEQIKLSSELCSDKKLYISLNKIPHEKDLEKIAKFFDDIKNLKIDGIYVIEPGVLNLVKEKLPNVKVFLSEQANITNYQTAKFWYDEGIKRVVLSKEMSVKDITQIVENTPRDLESEIVAHGSLLISHSGRKLLSNFLKDKNGQTKIDDSVKYNLVEEKRQGLYFPVYEDERGTFLFNTEDMCMIEFIPELLQTKVNSIKIDTRLKNIEYTLEAIKAYKKAIDEYYEKGENWTFNKEWIKNLDDINTRNYTSGFYIKKSTEE